MQLDLSNIQESIVPYGFHQGKKIGEVPVKYFQEIKEKAPNKRSMTEKLILNFINEENDKISLIGKLSGKMISLKVNGEQLPLTCEKVKQQQLNKLLSDSRRNE